MPKAEHADLLGALGERLDPGRRVVPLVETAPGVINAYHLASSPSVLRLAFGSIDFANDINAQESDKALLFARSTLVVTSRAAGLAAPIDGVTTAIHDETTVTADARHGRALGFGAKLCIHPAQLQPVTTAFAPTTAEIDWARRMLDHLDGPGASSSDGHLVDRPVIERARRILHDSNNSTTPTQDPMS